MDDTRMSDSASALWYVAPHRAEIRPAAAPAPAAGELHVRALTSGISRGTESLIWSGRVPDSERERMRGPHQEGDFPFPVKYGYQMVGVVEDGPAELAGRTVFCLHPHQTRFTIPASEALPVPDTVPPARAVLAANMETALNACWDAAPRPGDRIAVVGGGVVGCLVAWLCGRMPGTAVTLIDIDPGRAAVATALGIACADPDHAPAGCDLVFHASASAAGLSTAIGCAGFEATVVELSWYGEAPVAVPLGGAFHSQRLTILGSQVGSVAPARRARWPYRRRLELALSMLADERLDALLSGETPFDELPSALPALLDRPGALCHRVTYP